MDGAAAGAQVSPCAALVIWRRAPGRRAVEAGLSGRPAAGSGLSGRPWRARSSGPGGRGVDAGRPLVGTGPRPGGGWPGPSRCLPCSWTRSRRPCLRPGGVERGHEPLGIRALLGDEALAEPERQPDHLLGGDRRVETSGQQSCRNDTRSYPARRLHHPHRSILGSLQGLQELFLSSCHHVGIRRHVSPFFVSWHWHSGRPSLRRRPWPPPWTTRRACHRGTGRRPTPLARRRGRRRARRTACPCSSAR